MRVKKATSRILALLTALIMAFALMPAMAQAASDKSTNIVLVSATEGTLTAGLGAKTDIMAYASGADQYNGDYANPQDPKKGIVDFKVVNPEGKTIISKDKAETVKKGGTNCWFNAEAVGEATIIIYAVDNPEIEQPVTVTVVEDLLTVKQDGTIKKVFKGEDITAMQKVKPVQKNLTYSGRNHSFSFKLYEKVTGSKLEDYLTTAGIDVAALADDQIIRFIPSEGETKAAELTVKQLFKDKRYYFKKVTEDNLKEGAAATPELLEDAVEVPTVICDLNNTDSKLTIGQIAPNERTRSVSVHNMTTGGTIDVLSKKATKIACDVKPDKPSGGKVAPGQEIKLNSATILQSDIYFTTDGTVPTPQTSALYNYRTKEMSGKGDTGLKNAVIKAPQKEGKFVIKVMQMAYGRLDSNAATFEFNVQAVKKGTTETVNGAAYTVTKPAGTAAGTVIFKKAKNAKNVTVPKTVTLYDGKTYNVTTVAPKAFTGSKIRKITVSANVNTLKANALKGSKATTLVIKSKKLTKKSVKGSLKGSKVKKVQVKVGNKKLNKKYAKKYKKIFTRKNAGKRVRVK